MRDAKTEEVKRNIGQVSDPINLVPRILPQPRFHRMPICPKLWRPFLYPTILAPKLLEWNVSMNKNGDYRNRTRHLSIMSKMYSGLALEVDLYPLVEVDQLTVSTTL